MLSQLNLVGSSNAYIHPLVDPQRTVNMYIHADNKSLLPVLIDFPAYEKKVNISDTLVGRRLFTNFRSQTLYGIIGNQVYSFDSLLVPNNIGSIATSVGNAFIAANNNQEVIFVDGVNGYLFDEGTATFSTITATGFPPSPEFVVYIDGYFIVNSSGTPRFYVSELNDGLGWDSERYDGLIAKPDIVVGLGAVHRQLFVIGEISTEVYFNAADSAFPFRRQNNLILPYGCAAAGSIATGQNRLFWLSNDENGVGSIMMTDGTLPINVSTPNIDIAIQSYADVSDARGYIYKIDGHIFYELNFTAADHSWTYDLTTDRWFEREFEGEKRYKGQTHSYFLGKHYLLLYDEGNLYELSSEYDGHGDYMFRRERTGTRIKDPTSRPFTVNEIGINFLQGVGKATGIYENPLVFISLSEDGGVTFGDRLPASLGKIGQRKYKTHWHRLGKYNDLTTKLEFFARTKLIILDAYIDYTICAV